MILNVLDSAPTRLLKLDSAHWTGDRLQSNLSQSSRVWAGRRLGMVQGTTFGLSQELAGVGCLFAFIFELERRSLGSIGLKKPSSASRRRDTEFDLLEAAITSRSPSPVTALPVNIREKRSEGAGT